MAEAEEDVRCPRCGSGRVIPNARLIEQDYGATHTVRVGEFASPSDAFFRWESKVAVRAHVCGDCGYIELFAADPDRLYEAYQRARKKSG